MPWNPWIRIEDETSPDETVRDLYRAARGLDGEVSDLVRITSRTPGVSRLIHELGGAVYASAKGFSLREKEIVALVTSAFIGCVH